MQYRIFGHLFCYQPIRQQLERIPLVFPVIFFIFGAVIVSINVTNVVAAMDLMMDDLAYGISKRRVTLSTSGVVPALDRLAETSEVSLAISLHAPNDARRDQLVPINRRFQERNGYLETCGDQVFSTYPYALLEVFLLLAQNPRLRGVRAGTIRVGDPIVVRRLIETPEVAEAPSSGFASAGA